MTVAYDVFKMQLTTFLREQGYVRPDLIHEAWIKDRYVVHFFYEHREHAGISFGVASAPIDKNFPEFHKPWFSNCIKPYAIWLAAAGIESHEFAKALGGWEPEGLRLPGFDHLLAVIETSLPQIEAVASNISFQATR